MTSLVEKCAALKSLFQRGAFRAPAGVLRGRFDDNMLHEQLRRLREQGFSMLSRSQLNKLAESLQGIAVWGCLPGSRAQRVGLRYGDVLLSVNGVRTSNVDDYLEARALRADVVELVVFRDGTEISLDIQLDPGREREATRDDLEAVARDVVAARLLPTERPPPPDRDQV